MQMKVPKMTEAQALSQSARQLAKMKLRGLPQVVQGLALLAYGEPQDAGRIKEIAHQLGFREASYFSQYFTNKMHTT